MCETSPQSYSRAVCKFQVLSGNYTSQSVRYVQLYSTQLENVHRKCDHPARFVNVKRCVAKLRIKQVRSTLHTRACNESTVSSIRVIKTCTAVHPTYNGKWYEITRVAHGQTTQASRTNRRLRKRGSWNKWNIRTTDAP